MKYSLDKYKFYQFKNENGGMTIVAASTYAGKTVRGVAICAPGDNFNLEFGKKLAAARCNEKVAAKRYERANRKLNDILDQKNEIFEQLCDAENYYHDSFIAYNEAAQEVDRLINSLAK